MNGDNLIEHLQLCCNILAPKAKLYQLRSEKLQGEIYEMDTCHMKEFKVFKHFIGIDYIKVIEIPQRWYRWL